VVAVGVSQVALWLAILQICRYWRVRRGPKTKAWIVMAFTNMIVSAHALGHGGVWLFPPVMLQFLQVNFTWGLVLTCFVAIETLVTSRLEAFHADKARSLAALFKKSYLLHGANFILINALFVLHIAYKVTPVYSLYCFWMSFVVLVVLGIFVASATILTREAFEAAGRTQHGHDRTSALESLIRKTDVDNLLVRLSRIQVLVTPLCVVSATAIFLTGIDVWSLPFESMYRPMLSEYNIDRALLFFVELALQCLMMVFFWRPLSTASTNKWQRSSTGADASAMLLIHFLTDRSDSKLFFEYLSACHCSENMTFYNRVTTWESVVHTDAEVEIYIYEVRA
jgi:hypothetical protein